jgi:Rps23 Pro-64 3,4-dihydroxylase Tpa1-like proline 4-hydroxylase
MVFDYGRWRSALVDLAGQYRRNRPFPHILLAEFLEPAIARDVAEQFPAAQSDSWIHWQHRNEDKHGLCNRTLFPPYLDALTEELNSPDFLRWLSQLTGIPNLLSDPSLEGGGLHQSVRGGFLNIHADFSHHHHHTDWRRRVNLLLYLNVNWQAEWGGELELWDATMSRCVAKYPPLLNHAVIFNTDDHSFHGLPEPLRCPEGAARNSLALYYYTLDARSKIRLRATDYRARPSDSLRESALIWLDKQAVSLYSKAKAFFGFSDGWASRILRHMSKIGR